MTSWRDELADAVIPLATLAAITIITVAALIATTCAPTHADGPTWDEGAHTPPGVDIQARELFLKKCQAWPTAPACVGQWSPNEPVSTLRADPEWDAAEASELCKSAWLFPLHTHPWLIVACEPYGGPEIAEGPTGPHAASGYLQLLTWPPLNGSAGGAPFFAWSRCVSGPTKGKAHVYIACRLGGPGPEVGE